MSRLEPGLSLPEFKVSDIEGNPVNSDSYKGKKLLISFFRYSECLFCNLRIHKLIQKYPAWQEQEFEIIAFMQSPKSDILKYTGKQQAPFPIIADPDMEIYKKYGVELNNPLKWALGWLQWIRALKAFSIGYGVKFGQGNTSLIPADFLITEDQKIHTSYYGSDISDHLPLKSIEAFIQSK